jgi:hypothetical protein
MTEGRQLPDLLSHSLPLKNLNFSFPSAALAGFVGVIDNATAATTVANDNFTKLDFFMLIKNLKLRICSP